MKPKRMILCGALTATLFVSAAFAQMHGAGGQSTQQMGPREEPKNEMVEGPEAEAAFLKKAIELNMAEIQTAQLAQQTSADDQIKQFAQQVQDDHGKILDVLKQAAEQLSVPVPQELSKNSTKRIEKLKTLSGDAFDQAYIKETIKSHKEEDETFKNETRTTTSPQLKDIAASDAQMVQGHLQQIQKIAVSKGKAKN